MLSDIYGGGDGVEKIVKERKTKSEELTKRNNDMIRLLQISDIHFKRLPDARDEYAQLKERLFEKVEEISKDGKIDCILICGDVAFSGNKDEYEQKAKVFISKLLGIIGGKSAQVYMVPGNHDKNRDAKYNHTRTLLRESMLNSAESYNHFFNLYLDENDVYDKWLVPFEAYYTFANEYRCVPDVVGKSKTGEERKVGDGFYWEDEMNVGSYKLRLHGINTCYVSDWDDEKHEQILPKELYHTTKNKRVVNVSIMHHPLEFVKDNEVIEKDVDKIYQIQFYGHIHKQTIENNGALKIYSGAIMPPKEDGNGEDGYEPVFNIIEFREGQDSIDVMVKPYKWEWIDKEDGRFVNQKEEGSFKIMVDDANVQAEVQNKALKLPKGVKQRNVEVEFLQSDHSDAIIAKMYDDFRMSDDPVADAAAFFERVRKDDRYVDLYNYIHE